MIKFGIVYILRILAAAAAAEGVVVAPPSSKFYLQVGGTKFYNVLTHRLLPWNGTFLLYILFSGGSQKVCAVGMAPSSKIFMDQPAGGSALKLKQLQLRWFEFSCFGKYPSSSTRLSGIILFKVHGHTRTKRG